MKTYTIHYRIKKTEYTTKIMAVSMRVARHKLSIAHKCVIQAVKVIDYTEEQGV
jgi:hypothetical protein